ncbi:hypothetical protein JKP88DRAFT_294110 [Tribonema minus]|uniref:Sulfhydryl oxidase n=1 Tax=Tribonema minus TaxID=303371 RepID=A0A835ZH80_9STRA|nr:hypothetical protein JKP88DRAFT_294110 [Tribonema minus]
MGWPAAAHETGRDLHSLVNYSSGLWSLFHVLTLSPARGAARAQETQAAIRTFVDRFFGCAPCRAHFLGAVDACDAGACAVSAGPRALALWLWRMHNAVNVRVAQRRGAPPPLRPSDAYALIHISDAPHCPAPRHRVPRQSTYWCREWGVGASGYTGLAALAAAARGAAAQPGAWAAAAVLACLCWCLIARHGRGQRRRRRLRVGHRPETEDAARPEAANRPRRPSLEVAAKQLLGGFKKDSLSAWGLNKVLQREVKVAVTVKVIVNKEVPAAVFRTLLITKTVKHLVVHGAMPRILVMSNTIGALELHGVRGRVKDIPQHLHSLTLVLPQGLGSAYAAAYLNMLPETVHSLALDASRCYVHGDLELPACLRTLRLRNLRELPALPTSLTSITLESCYLEDIVQLPPSVTEASLSESTCNAGHFTRTSIAVERPSLRRLRLMRLQPSWAVQPLPQGLTDLAIDYHYTSWIEGVSVALTVLPQSLETLTLSCSDRRLNLTLGALPQGLKTLSATRFALINSALSPLPERLAHLSLGRDVSHALGALLAGLRELRIHDGSPWGICKFNQPLGTLPPSLQVLDLHQCYQFNQPLGSLPRALRQLRLGAVFNQPLLPLQHASLPAVQGQQAAAPALGAGAAAEPLQPVPNVLVRLPETLTMLHVGNAFDHPLGPLPEGLTELRVGSISRDGRFSHAIVRLPDALRELRLSCAGDPPLSRIPARLEVLVLGDAFDAALPAALPRTLRELHLGHRFNAPLALPPALEVLTIGDGYTHRLDLAALPLKKLCVSHGYAHALPRLPGTRVIR